jgi:AraC-like DNA-binding protein
MRKEKVCFMAHNILVMQVSGQLSLETSSQKVSTRAGEMMLIGKNQLAQLTKTPLPPEESYETIIISLQEDLLRKIALEEQIGTSNKYHGPSNVLIPPNDFLKGYFQSVVPYVRSSSEQLNPDLGMLKVKEGVKLLLHAMPELRSFLFDFSEPYKIDLEKFMISNYHFNVPLEKFAQLTGRSLAAFKRDFKKTFNTSPRHWLQERRLAEARHLLEDHHRKASAIYLDLGFESLSHFSHSFKKRFGKAPRELSAQLNGMN